MSNELLWSALLQLLDPRLIIVLLACWAVGFSLKQTPHVPNWTIVYAVTALAVVFSILLLGLTAIAVLQGIICGIASVYGYEFYKSAKEGVRETK